MVPSENFLNLRSEHSIAVARPAVRCCGHGKPSEYLKLPPPFHLLSPPHLLLSATMAKLSRENFAPTCNTARRVPSKLAAAAEAIAVVNPVQRPRPPPLARAPNQSATTSSSKIPVLAAYRFAAGEAEIFRQPFFFKGFGRHIKLYPTNCSPGSVYLSKIPVRTFATKPASAVTNKSSIENARAQAPAEGKKKSMTERKFGRTPGKSETMVRKCRTSARLPQVAGRLSKPSKLRTAASTELEATSIRRRTSIRAKTTFTARNKTKQTPAQSRNALPAHKRAVSTVNKDDVKSAQLPPKTGRRVQMSKPTATRKAPKPLVGSGARQRDLSKARKLERDIDDVLQALDAFSAEQDTLGPPLLSDEYIASLAANADRRSSAASSVTLSPDTSPLKKDVRFDQHVFILPTDSSESRLLVSLQPEHDPSVRQMVNKRKRDTQSTGSKVMFARDPLTGSITLQKAFLSRFTAVQRYQRRLIEEHEQVEAEKPLHAQREYGNAEYKV
ncbi:hypothetical protein BU26DRAFT_301628 [Trematosphaeria pertusa]|uniref:Uncharacterized protein n=1 Tax=Trematosphaeria pertusa TaxID=390896 RepID=A0A6A6IIK4_9PLEO|nr:uncharacterized protein BU26DRAFT_301628 [Trematosphaeria pertusa]KAF2250435.1 hypothetical protein BU26DRAFT_301628 [Trematosphaeria pertusa]